MTSTPQNPAGASENEAAPATPPVAQTPASVIAGATGQAGAAPTVDGREVAPLRAKYPTPGNGWLVLGVGLFLVALMFAFADISVSQRDDMLTKVQECGTLISPQDPEDPEWIQACERSHDQRTRMVAVPGVLGALSLGYGAFLRTRRRPTPLAG